MVARRGLRSPPARRRFRSPPHRPDRRRRKRRQRQDRRGDLRLVGSQRQHDRRRRARACRQRVGQRPAHQRRGVVEQHQHHAFGGGGIVGRQIGIKIGARQRPGCFRSLAGRRRADPIEKMADDHCFRSRHVSSKRCDPKRRDVNKPFTIIPRKNPTLRPFHRSVLEEIEHAVGDRRAPCRRTCARLRVGYAPKRVHHPCKRRGAVGVGKTVRETPLCRSA